MRTSTSRKSAPSTSSGGISIAISVHVYVAVFFLIYHSYVMTFLFYFVGLCCFSCMGCANAVVRAPLSRAARLWIGVDLVVELQEASGIPMNSEENVEEFYLFSNCNG